MGKATAVEAILNSQGAVITVGSQYLCLKTQLDHTDSTLALLTL
jgi:hypothetical protein